MTGWIIYALLFATITTTGLYTIHAASTAHQPAIGRHAKRI